eukprot:COSAG02_NODE_3559_length_6563_cov_4.152382_7_plen_43_part_00
MLTPNEVTGAVKVKQAIQNVRTLLDPLLTEFRQPHRMLPLSE